MLYVIAEIVTWLVFALVAVASCLGIWLLGSALFQRIVRGKALKRWQWLVVLMALIWGIVAAFVVSRAEYSEYWNWMLSFFLVLWAVPIAGGYVVALLTVKAFSGWSEKTPRKRFVAVSLVVFAAFLIWYFFNPGVFV